MPKPLNVLVGICSTGTWQAEFGLCLLQVVADFSLPLRGYDADKQNLMVDHKQGSILPNLRETICQKALDKQATHVLFLDTDQTFPRHTLRQLLSWGKPVVACNIATKTFPSSPTARSFNIVNDKGELVYSSGKTGLEKVWRVGTGVMLIEREVLENVPEPWFAMRWRENARVFQGEDWTFCEKLQEHGYEIFVDHGLSLDIGHIGKQKYDHELILPPEPETRMLVDPAEFISKGGLTLVRK